MLFCFLCVPFTSTTSLFCSFFSPPVITILFLQFLQEER
jgi:hypothetical protein